MGIQGTQEDENNITFTIYGRHKLRACQMLFQAGMEIERVVNRFKKGP